MSPLHIVPFVAWLIWLGCATPTACADDEGIAQVQSIGQRTQLFLDQQLIESLHNLHPQLHQPTKYAGNPVLGMVPADEDSWDAGLQIYFSSVLWDEDENLFKLWYALWAPGGGDADSVLAYATSQDGITWEKPSLGIFDFRGTTDNNIVMDRSGLASGVIKDVHEADPARRYKMLHMWGDYRVYASYSADGLHWHRYNDGKHVIYHAPGHDSQMVPYWDAGLQKYVAIVRDRTGWIKDVRPGLISDETARDTWRALWNPGSSPEKHTLRRVGQAESDDFVHWTPVRVVMEADAKDPLNRDQFYNMSVMHYAGLRIGMMTVYSDDVEYCRGSVQLTCSRDGRNWQRAGDRQVFLPLSERPGDFDWGYLHVAQAPVVVGDEIYIFYDGHGHDHRHQLPEGVTQLTGGIGLARLRRDGFVSLDAGAAEGTLTTRTLVCDGSRLEMNADARGGQVRVAILDADGRPIPGFGEQDCDPLQADELDHTVSWNGKSDVGSLAGRTVKLRIHLRQAKLYSFRFAGSRAVSDQRVTVTIEDETTIVPAAGEFERAMMSMVRHPDGSIYLNTQTQGVLYQSTDEGATWKTMEVNLPDVAGPQAQHGLGVSGDGRLWLMHQSQGRLDDLFVSVSDDGGTRWTTTPIDFAGLAPGAPDDPFDLCANDFNTFFERPDGTMLLGVGLRYDDWKEYGQQDQSRPGFHETLIRSTDGGRTWGDPTEVHAHVAETQYAVNPRNPDHILAMTRIQRMMLRGETEKSLTRDLGHPPPNLSWPYKGAILLESTDGGRSFAEVPDSYLGYYSHRGSMLWTEDDIIVAPHTARGPTDYRLVVNISLDGGRTWVDGTPEGTGRFNAAQDFVLVPSPPGFSFMTPTVQLGRDRFLTTYYHGQERSVKGLFWRIRRSE